MLPQSKIKDNDGNLPFHYLGNPNAFDPTTAFLVIQLIWLYDDEAVTVHFLA